MCGRDDKRGGRRACLVGWGEWRGGGCGGGDMIGGREDGWRREDGVG